MDYEYPFNFRIAMIGNSMKFRSKLNKKLFSYRGIREGKENDFAPSITLTFEYTRADYTSYSMINRNTKLFKTCFGKHYFALIRQMGYCVVLLRYINSYVPQLQTSVRTRLHEKNRNNLIRIALLGKVTDLKKVSKIDMTLSTNTDQ